MGADISLIFFYTEEDWHPPDASLDSFKEGGPISLLHQTDCRWIK